MHFYSPSPLSLGYIPLGSYRPALVSTYLDDESSPALTFEGLPYPAFSHTFLPRLDAETRYRRALHELQTAEEELEAHALQPKFAEEYERHQRAPQAQVVLDQARRQKRALPHAFVDNNPGDLFASEGPFAKRRLTHSGPSCSPVLHDSEVPTLEGLLELFTGIHPQPHSPLQQSGSPAPSRSAEHQPSEKQDAAADALTAVLEFIHGLATHARDAANGSETIPEPGPVPQPQAAPVDEKGKAKASPAAGPALLQTLLGAHTQGPSDQELKDIELAIKLSLEDRDAADAEKASAAKASRSSPDASSSRVKLDGVAPSSHAPSSASDTTSTTSKPITGPVPQPVSPLTTIRAVRNQLSTLEPAIKFPAVLDFDQSVLAISPNNAPLRAYENMLNGLLEQLDAIESDGDEEVRSVRKEVVREVEKALEDLERRVSEKASKLQVTSGVEMKGYDVGAKELEVLAARDAVPADATLVVEGAEPTGREPSASASPSDADVDLAISEEYLSSPPTVEYPKPAVAELGDNAVAQTADEDVSSLDADETAPVLEDSSDSVATITVTPASGPLRLGLASL